MGADEASTSLPVELSSFTASVRGKNVELRWNTATETNNFGFEVERLSSRVGGNGTWEKVGFVPGAGTTNTPNEYRYSDDVAATGNYSYRLKQIDHDGRFEYHPAVEVSVVSTVTKYDLSQNFPNPFNPSTSIRFAVPVTEHATVRVYDVAGRQVAELFNGIATAGETYNVQFNGTGLSTGIYFYVLQSAGTREVKKMSLIK